MPRYLVNDDKGVSEAGPANEWARAQVWLIVFEGAV
jgi:hypothetical protein